MIAAITGGRTMALGPIGWQALDILLEDAEEGGRRISLLRHGAAPGADESAAAWAASRRISTKPYRADWQRLGKRAGPVRVETMLGDGADVVIAFAGGKGTAYTVRRAHDLGMSVVDYRNAAPCKAMRYEDVRYIVERGWSDREWAAWRARHPGVGFAVAQVGAFHGAPLPECAVYCGGRHHAYDTSILAMPCVAGNELGPEDAAGFIRWAWRHRPGFREAMTEIQSRGGLLVCSCGSRRCVAPVLATAVLAMECTKAMVRTGRELPSRAETDAALVAWGAIGMAAAADSA